MSTDNDALTVMIETAGRYANAKSYRDAGTIMDYKDEVLLQVIDFETVFVRPNQLKYVWKARAEKLLENTGHVLIDSNSIKYESRTSKGEVPFSWKNVSNLMPTFAGHTCGAFSLILHLLCPDIAGPNLGKVKEARFENMEPTPGEINLIITPQITPIPKVVQIREADMAISRITIEHRVNPLGLKKIVEKRLGWKKWITPGFKEFSASAVETKPYVTKTLITYSSIEFDFSAEGSLTPIR